MRGGRKRERIVKVRKLRARGERWKDERGW